MTAKENTTQIKPISIEGEGTFEQLLQESMSDVNMTPGKIIEATVVKVEPDFVVVNAGLKSEAHIEASEFKGEDIEVGDIVEVVVSTVENGFGETRLSHQKAKRVKVWAVLEDVHKSDAIVEGVIVDRVKGGFIVDLDSVSAFLPGSLVDVKPVRDPSYLEGKPLEFKIIKMDRRRNNVVVSRRAVMEAESSSEREERLAQLQEGMEVMGTVKNTTDYGAFVDLGGIDGLLHITDMAWKRIKHPSDMLQMGDEVKVKILKFDREKQRVSLGLKQLAEDPWENISARYPVGKLIKGRVSNVTDYGCFVELETGVEGLVHMSEMDWTNKNIHPSKVVHSGQEVEVQVLDVDQDRRRISLGIKQCQKNPWQVFSDAHKVGDEIAGNVRSITDFGLFVGLNGGIDGLVHLSDISWDEPGEVAVQKYNKGDEVQTVILAIDSDRERISLGIKQLQPDTLSAYLGSLDKDAIINATVTLVEPKQATLKLSDDQVGVLRVNDYSDDPVRDLQTHLTVGQQLEVKIVNVDRDERTIYVSRRALHQMPRDKRKLTSGDVPTNTTLGALLKERMKREDDDSTDDK